MLALFLLSRECVSCEHIFCCHHLNESEFISNKTFSGNEILNSFYYKEEFFFYNETRIFYFKILIEFSRTSPRTLPQVLDLGL